MSQATKGKTADGQTKLPDFTEGANLNVANPVILLVGKTGAGKSTLGNLLLSQPHDEGPFFVSADMESVTKECGSATMSIDGVMYNVVDTPGIFDTQQVTDEILKEIAKAVQKCAYGVKAILFVFEAKRFTAEQKNVLNGIRMFLGEDATNYIIAVFSHATKAQISERNTMRKAWNAPVRSFIHDIENRWGISPNSDYYPPDHPIHKARLGEIMALISGMRGVYTTEQLEKSRKEQEEVRRKKEEEIKRAKKEYEEKLKESARKQSEEAHKRKVEEMQREQKARQEQEEKLRARERQEAERKIEELRKEQKARQEYEENLRKKDRAEAEQRHKEAMDLLKQERKERQMQEENFRKREQEAEERRRVREAEERRERQEREESLRREERQEAEERYRRRLEEVEQERSNQERQEYMALIEEMRRQREESERRYQEMLEQSRNTDTGGDGGCFSLDTKVQLANGKFIEMEELQVGDRVCSNVRNGKLEFSEVYLISHIGHCESPLEMIKIEFTSPDGQKSQVRMTTTHCIFREDLSILYAQDVVPDETKILVLNEENKLIPVIVDDLTIEKDTGYVSFYTRAGTVIANNTLCSCYDECPPSQAFMDLIFAPIRWWTKVYPSNHRQEELHPYVQTLETAYFTLCDASNIGKRLFGL